MRDYLRGMAFGAGILGIAGCSWLGALAPGEGALLGAGGQAGTVVPAPYLLEGSVRVGLVANNANGLVSNNAGGLVSNNTNGLSNGNPLAVMTPLARATGLSAATRVTPVEALASATPVTQLDEALGYRTQGEGSRIVVEIVDPATGASIRRGRADSAGRYQFRFTEAPVSRGWILQATEVSGATVSAFLAAPVPTAPAGAARQVVDVSPASTMVVFTAALVSGVRSELRVDMGFRGVKTEQLAAMVTSLDGSAVEEAAAKLDAAKGLGDTPAAFETVLETVVDGSVALAQASSNLAADSGGKLAHVVAAENHILRGIGKEAEAAAEPAAVVDSSAKKVEVGKVAEEAKALVDGAADQAAILDAYVVSGQLGSGP